MSELTERLKDEQPIEASLRPRPTPDVLKAAIDRGLVYVKFINTRGGTDLCIRIDRDASDFAGADFGVGRGRVEIVGDLVLDYVPVRFRGVLDLETFRGTGALHPLETGGEVSPGGSDSSRSDADSSLLVDQEAPHG
jgi:hypothetical protein